jgi:alginate O-acetyltransferase complex protein AlgJ
MSTTPAENLPVEKAAGHLAPAGLGPVRISRATAWTMAIVFLVIIASPGIYQFWYDTHFFGRSRLADLLIEAPTKDSLDLFQTQLTNESRLNRFVRHDFWKYNPWEKPEIGGVITARDGFLFYNPDRALYTGPSLTAPPPATTADVLPAMIDYDRQLRRRGIHLVVMLIPTKMSIYPEKIAPDYPRDAGPAVPPGYEEFLGRARGAGIDMLDLTDAFWRAKDQSPDPVFWPTDTHWSQRGRAMSADIVAGHIKPMVADSPVIHFDEVAVQSVEPGNLGKLLAGGGLDVAFPPIRATYTSLRSNGKPFVADDQSPVLILGDSFTNIGEPEGYGFDDELMLRLKVGVQAVTESGSSYNEARRKLLKLPNVLAKKKVVVWEIPGVYLYSAWEKIGLPG